MDQDRFLLKIRAQIHNLNDSLSTCEAEVIKKKFLLKDLEQNRKLFNHAQNQPQAKSSKAKRVKRWRSW